MREIIGVQSSADEVKPFEVNVTTTYVRTNIKRITVEVEPAEYNVITPALYDADGNIVQEAVYGDEIVTPAVTIEMWEYDEKQFDNKEYVEALSDKTQTIGLDGKTTAEALALVETALTELIKLVYSKIFGIK